MKDTMGIDLGLDWERILHLFKIGIFASILVLIGDMLLGYGVADKSLSGMEGMLSAYVTLSDTRIFWSSLLGLIGIPVEGLCYFGIYRLIASSSMKYAHIYRAGILGYLIFGACGVHVPCLMACYIYKTLYEIDTAMALEKSIRFAMYFMAPSFLLFTLSFFIIVIVQIIAFAKGKTPYPRWCWIFSLGFIVIVDLITSLFSSYPLVNAFAAGWISIANLWMFTGLLLVGKKIVKTKESSSASES